MQVYLLFHVFKHTKKVNSLKIHKYLLKNYLKILIFSTTRGKIPSRYPSIFSYSHNFVNFTVPNEFKIARREYFNRWYGLKAYYWAHTLSTIPPMVCKYSWHITDINLYDTLISFFCLLFSDYFWYSFYDSILPFIKSTN